MPKAVYEIQHDLGIDEAVRRLKRACEWGRGVSDLQARWSENNLEFSVTVQGVKVSGIVQVNADSLNLNAKLPLIAVPFKSWLPNILRNAIKERKEYLEAADSNAAKPIILYLHIPKAGGTTLGEFIYNQVNNESEVDEGLIKNGVFFYADGFFKSDKPEFSPAVREILRRPDLRAITGHFSYGIHEYVEKPFSYITILRNPVKRIISLYNYLRLESRVNLEDFVRNPQYREVDNDQTRRIAGVNPEIGKLTEKDLEKAKENLRSFAAVGVTERFDETLILLKNSLNLNKDVVSIPRNVGKKDVEIVSDSTLELIKNRNLFDVELHDFANKLMNQAITKNGSAFQNELAKQKSLV